jgi:glycosyltransferase involved in cell wall biosynthesis
MKILHVITTMDPRAGGPCQGVRNLEAQVSGHGEAVEVVCLDDPNAEYLSRETIKIHALGQGRGGLWRYHPALRPWLEENLPRFDAVILNGLWQYPAYALSRVTRRPDSPPYFAFAHGMLDPWFQRAPGRRLKAMRNWVYWKLVEQHVVHNATAMFFTCEEELRLARETFRPYHPQKEINVGYGIMPPPAYRAAIGEAFLEKCPGVKGQPYLLFLSRIDPKKGVDLLLKAWAGVCKSGSGMVPKLVIAGPGLESAYGQQMQRLAGELFAPGNVFWPGMLTGDAKWGALHGCEAFALTSHQENFGIAVAEALACGKPVLISNQINIWREIAEDKAGLVAPDTEAGAEQLVNEWQNLSAAAKAQMGRNATTAFEKRFSIAITAKKYIDTVIDLSSLFRESRQSLQQ